MNDIQRRAAQFRKTIVFPESNDPRILRAAAHMHQKKLVRPILVGRLQEINQIAQQEGVQLNKEIPIVNFEQCRHSDELVHHFYKRRKHKGMTKDKASRLLRDNPLLFGAAMVALAYADGAVAGSISTTADVIKAAIQAIGVEEETSIVSSIFLMAFSGGKIYTYGDCGVVPYPDAAQLADIAIQSSRTHKKLTGQEPVTAMLSFSTKGSAKHEKVELVRAALKIASQRAPGLKIDGELQFDAAIAEEVGRRKAPDSDVAGKANVFIFPNLDSGNIAYKITERLAGAAATGPILQGLARPMMDLSRGCNWQDIVNAACVAVLMGQR